MSAVDDLAAELSRLKTVIGGAIGVDLRSDAERAQAAKDEADAEKAAAAAAPPEEAPPVEEIIDDYDNKTVAEIQAELGGQTAEQLDALAAHEAANKNRVTVLDAVAAAKAALEPAA
jgi:hypothetical protein